MLILPLEYLKHILDEIEYIRNETQKLSKDDFLQNNNLKRAFVRSLEIIGEAAKKIPDTLKQKYGHIDWRAIAGMRDKLIHAYFGIDYDIVWDVIVNKLPMLQKEVEQILQDEQDG